MNKERKRKKKKKIFKEKKRRFSLSLSWSFIHGRSRPLASDPASELDVFGLDGDPVCVDGAQVSVLKQANEVGLCGLLEGGDGRGLEPQIGLEPLSDLSDEALKGELADEELGRLLVAADLAEGHGAGAVP